VYGLSDNVIRFTNLREVTDQVTEGGSAPFTSCTFHGLRGKRAIARWRDTVCHLKYVRTDAIVVLSLGSTSLVKGREWSN